MNKPSNKILLLIIAVLLLTNIAVLVYFLGYRQDGEEMKSKGATELLKEQVGFSQEQLDRYKQLRDQQRETIRPMYERMRNTKDSLFRLLSDTAVSDGRLDDITGNIGSQQKSLDLLTFRHFSELRKICRPEQRVAYDSMVVQLFRRMGKPQKSKTDEKK
ncbi:MAG: periplasmic heavy metal sensor [Chitinophagaceae bacterium]|nr:MAG: periplasmic heavy metal sensor [Chitinophagaceae bacterium]